MIDRLLMNSHPESEIFLFCSLSLVWVNQRFCGVFGSEAKKVKLTKASKKKNFSQSSRLLWSAQTCINQYPCFLCLPFFLLQVQTHGRLCPPKALWCREATATAASTTGPAAACSSTAATRRWATTSSAWWTTCTATMSAREHGEERTWPAKIKVRPFVG